LNESRDISKRLVITGTLLIWIIKFGIRPLHIGSEPLLFFLNVAPNFLGSFLIPFGACWFFSNRDHFVGRVFRTRTQAEINRVCLLGFSMLVVNEYLQKIPVFGRTFDLNDIFFSALGLLLASLLSGRWLIVTERPSYYDQR